MADQENNQYILGTEKAELFRLGVQHQVWSEEATKGWNLAQFGAGQTILDLGCGPGFCSQELSYLVGDEGQVIAVDKSKTYIDFVERLKVMHGLNIKTILSDFEHLELEKESLDGIYSRWALAWIDDVEALMEKLVDALLPGGAMVFHEYYDWSVFQSSPHFENLLKGIRAIFKSFADSSGDINIGKKLPEICTDFGLEVINTRPMTKLVTPDHAAWQWPYTFLNIYMPKLVDTGYLTQDEVDQALGELEELSSLDYATILCPIMTEVIAVKV